jgi:hypothetical protein
MDVIQLLSAAGIGGIIGSLLTTLAQSWLSHRSYVVSRNFQEKKEAYVGLLQAMHDSKVLQTVQAAQYAAHWRNRVELVGSKEVNACIARVAETNPVNGQVHPNRPRFLIELKHAMRQDLGVEA